MQTETKEYQEYLGNKYLPGRSIYLNAIFYPKILKSLGAKGSIADLGCGYGEFLEFCKRRSIEVVGIDSNQSMVDICQRKGYRALADNICSLDKLKNLNFEAAICDNVLEHLNHSEIQAFFENVGKILSNNGTLVCIVPDKKGYKKDPTHKTFITRELIEYYLNKNGLVLAKHYNHPLNLGFLNRFFYLIMQVFVIKKEQIT